MGHHQATTRWMAFFCEIIRVTQNLGITIMSIKWEKFVKKKSLENLRTGAKLNNTILAEGQDLNFSTKGDFI